MNNSMKIKQIFSKTPQEIILLEEVKEYLKIDFSEQDQFISNTIRAVREYAEKFLSLHLVKKEFFQMHLGQNLQTIALMHKPVLEIKSLSIVNGEREVIKINQKEYYFDQFNKISISKLATLYNLIQVNYIVGYEDPDLIPMPIKTGMLMHIASIYDRGDLGEAIPQSTLNLYQPYRRPHL